MKPEASETWSCNDQVLKFSPPEKASTSSSRCTSSRSESCVDFSSMPRSLTSNFDTSNDNEGCVWSDSLDHMNVKGPMPRFLARNSRPFFNNFRCSIILEMVTWTREGYQWIMVVEGSGSGMRIFLNPDFRWFDSLRMLTASVKLKKQFLVDREKAQYLVL